MNKILKAKNISVHFGDKKVLDNLDLELYKGKIHALIGPNGAGKTTLSKVIIGLLEPKKGSKVITDSKITFISDSNLFPLGLSAKNYVSFVLNGSGIKTSSSAIKEQFKYFGIEDKMKKDPRKFSAGQKKKVMLIQAMLSDSSIIIMDEPTANLDVTSRRQMNQTFKELTKHGKTLLITTHLLEEIDEVFDYAHVLNKGKIQSTTTRTEIDKNAQVESERRYILMTYNVDEFKTILKDIGYYDIKMSKNKLTFTSSDDLMDITNNIHSNKGDLHFGGVTEKEGSLREHYEKEVE